MAYSPDGKLLAFGGGEIVYDSYEEIDEYAILIYNPLDGK